jgi:hypothetical protein
LRILRSFTAQTRKAQRYAEFRWHANTRALQSKNVFTFNDDEFGRHEDLDLLRVFCVSAVNKPSIHNDGSLNGKFFFFFFVDRSG